MNLVGVLVLLVAAGDAVPGDSTERAPSRVTDVLMQRTFSALLDFGMVESVPPSPKAGPRQQAQSAAAYILGREAAVVERYREAEGYWRQAVKYDPNNHAAWSELGHLLAGTGRHRAAVSAWQQVLDAPGPGDADLLFNCGLLETMLDEHASAASHLLRRRLMEGERITESVESIQLDAALAHSLRALGNVELAEALERERDELLLALSVNQATDLESGQRWMRLVEELFRLGDLEAARAAALIRLSEGPFEGEYAGHLASNLKMRFILLDALLVGDGLSAISLIEDLDARGLLRGIPPDWRKPTSMAEALYEAGSDFATLGNSDGASRLFAEVLRHDPSHVLARNNLGYAALNTGPITSTDAVLIESALVDARAGHDALPTVLDTMGWLRYMQSHLEDDEHARGALSLLQESVDLQEEPDPIVLDHLGDAAWLGGHRDLAIKTWNEALERLRDPEFRGTKLRNYNLLQGGLWQFRVVESDSLYHREYGSLVDSLKAKLAAVEAGQPPRVAERQPFIR